MEDSTMTRPGARFARRGWIALRALSVGATLYGFFNAKGAYKLLRACVEQAAASGDVALCQRYPDSIELYLLIMLASVLIMLIIPGRSRRQK